MAPLTPHLDPVRNTAGSRVDNPQGSLCPGPAPVAQDFALYGSFSCPLPRPQTGQRPETVPAFWSMLEPCPYWAPQAPPHQLHYPQPNKNRWSGLGGQFDPIPHHQISNSHPTPRTSPFSSPSISPMLSSLQLPLFPRCSSNVKLVCTPGPLPMLFPLAGRPFPSNFPPCLCLLFQI